MKTYCRIGQTLMNRNRQYVRFWHMINIVNAHCFSYSKFEGTFRERLADSIITDSVFRTSKVYIITYVLYFAFIIYFL